MPYDKHSRHSSCPGDRPIGVVNKRTGKLMGCHGSDGSADRQIRALYASEGKKELSDELRTHLESGDTNAMLEALLQFEAGVDAAALAELEADASQDDVPEPDADETNHTIIASLAGAIKALVGRGHEKATYKRENGIDYPARDYAYVPDPANPSTWKLRLTESPGKVTLAQLRRAAAAFSAGGFRGNRVQLPAAVVAAVKRRIRAEYRKLGVADNAIPASVKESGRFAIWKQADGVYRWFAVYSNNFRDDDYPPEIISKESHELFVKMVDAGIVDYPELWHWHVPGTRWGKADWLDFADGFALASGTVDAGHEKEAEALAEMDDIGVSHGMPTQYVMYDRDDPSVLVMHVTSEISPLPMEAAANKLTGFTVLEDAMSLTQEKRAHLLALGIEEGKIAQLESGLGKAASVALEAGIESKEAATPPAADGQSKEADGEVANEAIETIVEGAGADTTPAPQYVTVDQLAGVMSELMSVLEAQAVKSREAMEALTKQVSDMAEAAKPAEAIKEQTPVLSLSSLLGQSGFMGGSQQPVDGRSALAKSKPAETKPTVSVTGLSWIDNMIAGEPAVEGAA